MTATRALIAKIVAVVVIEAVLVSLIVAGIGAELVTNFVIDRVPYDNESAIVVTNTGIIQANNVIFDGVFPGADGVAGGVDCMEGAIRVFGTGHIRATFERMTPNQPCTVALVPNGTDVSSVKITADGYLATWTPARAEYWNHFLERLLAGEIVFWFFFASQVVMALVILTDSVRSAVGYAILIFRRITWWMIDRRRPRWPFYGNIAYHLKSEYGLRAGRDEAAVVLMIFCGKDTMGQIIKHTKMTNGRAKHVLNRLIAAGIVVGDVPAIVTSLRKSLEPYRNDLCKCTRGAAFALDDNVGVARGGNDKAA